MSIDEIRTRPERTTTPTRSDDADDRYRHAGGSPARQQRLVDVSDVTTATVAEYARDAVGTDQVHLERRAGRTFLVVH